MFASLPSQIMNSIVLATLFAAAASGDSEKHLCAIFAENRDMGGRLYYVYATRIRQCHGLEQQYMHDPGYLNGWGDGQHGGNDEISSMQVSSGCWIDTYCGYWWGYHMQTFWGWTYTNLVRSWDNCISSYRCYCDKDLPPQRRRLGADSDDGQLPEQAVIGSAPVSSGPTDKELVNKCVEEQATVEMCTDACKICSQCLAVAFLPGQRNSFNVDTDCLGICETCSRECPEYFVCDKFGQKTTQTTHEGTTLALSEVWCQNFGTCGGQ